MTGYGEGRTGALACQDSLRDEDWSLAQCIPSRLYSQKLLARPFKMRASVLDRVGNRTRESQGLELSARVCASEV